jgi:hypothetical protein
MFETIRIHEEISAMLAADLDSLPTTQVGLAMRDITDEISRLRAVYFKLLARFDSAGGAQADGSATTAAWLRHYCNQNDADARRSTTLARRLRDLPVVADALAAGDLSEEHARLLCYLHRDLPEQTDEAAQAALVEFARLATVDQLRDACDVLRAQYAPEATRKAAERGWVERGVVLEKQFNGTWRMVAGMPPEIADAFLAYFDSAAAKQGETDERTPTQRRADALAELVLGALDNGTVGERPLRDVHGQRPHIAVTIDLAGLLDDAGHPLGQLLRAGAISAETVRRLACDAIVATVLTDGPSEILDLGRGRRTASAAQCRALRVRDRHCRVPGCTRPVREWHHIIWWEHGGATDLTNLVGLCLYHHHLMHEGGWRIDGDANQPLTFHAPDGRIFEEKPQPQLAA